MTLSPLNFTRNASKAGLSKPRCGVLAVAALQRLIVTPVLCREKKNNSDAPSDEQQMGCLIANGLAKLDKSAYPLKYIATDSGVKWIRDLQNAGLAAKEDKP